MDCIILCFCSGDDASYRSAVSGDSSYVVPSDSIYLDFGDTLLLCSLIFFNDDKTIRLCSSLPDTTSPVSSSSYCASGSISDDCDCASLSDVTVDFIFCCVDDSKRGCFFVFLGAGGPTTSFFFFFTTGSFTAFTNAFLSPDFDASRILLILSMIGFTMISLPCYFVEEA